MITKGIQQLVAEAEKRSKGIPVEEAKKHVGDASTVFVDIRDVRELEREGMIPGAFHAPRGMLEFWVDPASPYYKPVFTDDKTFILYCQADWGMGPTCCTSRAGSASGARPAGRPGRSRRRRNKDPVLCLNRRWPTGASRYSTP